jgi:hypothetical protein
LAIALIGLGSAARDLGDENLFSGVSHMIITIYDPPSGWRYGFPKPYKPLPHETLNQTLLRDGYPQAEIDWGAANHVRFWETDL